MKGRLELATFGMGCFWCSEASFSAVEGVVSKRVGYRGGTKEDPTYDEVCGGLTGHAEVVELHYDERTSFRELLDIFWSAHNPSASVDGDGDTGDQYRSSIFYQCPQLRPRPRNPGAGSRRPEGSGIV